jgi:hypothetical protein
MIHWELSRIPDTALDRILEAVQDHNTKELIAIHDEFNLSNIEYCCVQPHRRGEPQEWFELYLRLKGVEI